MIEILNVSSEKVALHVMINDFRYSMVIDKLYIMTPFIVTP